jgi:hypothetical protein
MNAARFAFVFIKAYTRVSLEAMHDENGYCPEIRKQVQKQKPC